jgi:Isochorismatase family
LAILPQLRTIVDALRIYKPDGSNVDLCRRDIVERGARIVSPGTSGVELADGLTEVPRPVLDADLLLSGRFQQLGVCEWMMYKPRCGAFFETHLESHMRSLGVTSLVFAGCNFPNCPRTSIYEASERDFRIVLVEDAVSGLYDQGRREIEGIGVCVLRSADLLDAISMERILVNNSPIHGRGVFAVRRIGAGEVIMDWSSSRPRGSSTTRAIPTPAAAMATTLLFASSKPAKRSLWTM